MKAGHEQENPLYEFGPFRLDPRERVLLRDGAVVPLLGKSFDALAVLVRNGGRLLDKDFLLASVWPDAAVEENSLAKAICDVRRALGDGPKDRHYIVTVPRRGYRFAASVTAVGGPNALAEGERRGDAGEAPEAPGAERRVTAVAVLPFVYLGPEAGDYLGVGMADAVITRLHNLRSVVVRPTSSVLPYADGRREPARAGRELKVDAVVSGSVRMIGDRVRVTVQLVGVEGESSLWAGTFDEEFTHMFAVEDSISNRVAAALSPRLTGEERRSLAKQHTRDPEAKLLYLRGRYFLSRREAREAIACFRRAIERDQWFAPAYAGLADCYVILGIQAAVIGSHVAPRDAYPEAKRAALRALELEPLLAEAHAALGHVTFFLDLDSHGAEAGYRRAIELNPHCATAHLWYAMTLAALDRCDEALARIGRAQDLDPSSLIIDANVGYVLYTARRFDEAMARLRETVRMDPSFAPGRFRLGLVFEASGMYGEAAAEFLESDRLSGGSTVALGALGHTYAISGREAEAREILERLARARETGAYVSPVTVAEVLIALGETERALDLLEASVDEREAGISRLETNPWWDPLRHEPRFQEVRRRIGLWP
jgi:DNA-binding winged helix-turn-helix (wHTH) protein/tetratricopeptide (TPR) repeat protein